MAYSFRSTLAPGPVGGNPGAPINPIGIPGGGLVLSIVGTIGYVAFCVAIFGSVVSLIVRFRRARLVERQQLKWLSSAAVLVGMTVLFGLLVDAVWGETGWATNVSNGTLTGSLVCVPVAVGIAVLRYRLYEIDRLISRTLVYASLAVAALFQPARRRIQAIVDRRFTRRRYNVGKTIEAFSGRLRDEIDIDTLSAELLAVVDQTMQPTMASLWLRPAVERSQGYRQLTPNRAVAQTVIPAQRGRGSLPAGWRRWRSGDSTAMVRLGGIVRRSQVASSPVTQ